MRHKPYSTQFKAALREMLHDLEEVRTVRRDDPELVRLKEHIRSKISEMETSESELMPTHT